jgi:hypothetical protein
VRGRAARIRRGRWDRRWIRSRSTKLTTTPVELDRLTIEEPVHRRRGGWRGRGRAYRCTYPVEPEQIVRALRPHPGVVDAKVGYFGIKSTKVYRVQMGTKPAKSRSLGPRCAKVRRGPHPAPTGASANRSSIHAASKVAKVGAAGGPKLLKWGRLRARGSNLLKSDRPLTSTVLPPGDCGTFTDERTRCALARKTMPA